MAILAKGELTPNKKYTGLLYGAPGCGKTTLACSAPQPVFVLDIEKGHERLSTVHQAQRSEVSTYDELMKDMQSEEYKAAETIVVDTIGALVQLMVGAIPKLDGKTTLKQNDGSLTLKGYGFLKNKFVKFLELVGQGGKKHIIFIGHEEEEKQGESTKKRIACEGKAKSLVWQPCDFGGYMYHEQGKRMISFAPSADYYSKGVHGIAQIYEIPDATGKPLTFLADTIFATMDKTRESTRFVDKKAQKAYAAAMSEGKDILNEVIDDETAMMAIEEMKGIVHALTSKAELNSLFANKLKELGLKFCATTKKVVKNA